MKPFREWYQDQGYFWPRAPYESDSHFISRLAEAMADYADALRKELTDDKVVT